MMIGATYNDAMVLISVLGFGGSVNVCSMRMGGVVGDDALR